MTELHNLTVEYVLPVEEHGAYRVLGGRSSRFALVHALRASVKCSSITIIIKLAQSTNYQVGTLGVAPLGDSQCPPDALGPQHDCLQPAIGKCLLPTRTMRMIKSTPPCAKTRRSETGVPFTCPFLQLMCLCHLAKNRTQGQCCSTPLLPRKHDVRDRHY